MLSQVFVTPNDQYIYTFLCREYHNMGKVYFPETQLSQVILKLWFQTSSTSFVLLRKIKIKMLSSNLHIYLIN